MPRFVFNRSKKLGKPPGTLIFIGDQKTQSQEINLIEYNGKTLNEAKDTQFDSIKNKIILETDDLTNWIDIIGLHGVENVEKIGSLFDLHPLTLEDILNTDQRPKFEEYQNYIFIVIKIISYDKSISEIVVEQASLVLGKGYLVTFEEQPSTLFNDLRERIRTKKGKIINYGPDYLAYSMIDVIVDNYFTVLEKMGEEIEDLEEELVINPKTETIQSIHQFKREMIALRKSVWPLREVITKLMRQDSEYVDEKTIIYLRDVYDHTIQVIDTIETYRDLLSGMLDIYLSSVSNRMNEIMKLLTLIGTIFIPLSFITGLYGMNFDRSVSPLNMPELGWSFGYIYVWVVMLSVVFIMLFYFRRKKWI